MSGGDLSTYLQDHLAGAKYAIEVLEFLRDHGDSGASVARTLLAEVEEDRTALNSIADRLGSDTSSVKEMAAWIGEKISEWKLRRGPFGTFQAWEIVALGILGKLALWNALETVRGSELKDVDLAALIERAKDQHRRAETARLEAARAPLGG